MSSEPANVSAASRADTSRQLAGCRPDCTIARTASQPASNERERHRRRSPLRRLRPHPHPGARHDRQRPLRAQQHSVRRRAAPEPGRRRDSQTSPPTVTARTLLDQVVDVGRPCREVARARVAIHPPSVESSNDCGKKRSVRPCSPSCCSSRGPPPPPRSAPPARRRRPRAAVEPREVDGDRALVRAAHGVDAADHARATAVGRDGEPRARAPLEHARTRPPCEGARRRRAAAGSARGTRTTSP